MNRYNNYKYKNYEYNKSTTAKVQYKSRDNNNDNDDNNSNSNNNKNDNNNKTVNNNIEIATPISNITTTTTNITKNTTIMKNKYSMTIQQHQLQEQMNATLMTGASNTKIDTNTRKSNKIQQYEIKQ